MTTEQHILDAADKMRRMQLWKAESEFLAKMLTEADAAVSYARRNIFRVDRFEVEHYGDKNAR